MSRTDKDTPYWVRSEWYEPYHTCTEHHSPRLRRFGACDLPAEPVIQRSQFWRRWPTRCHWQPAWEPRNFRRPGPPRWFRAHVWNSPKRTLVRGQLHRAATEYRATGDTDVIANTEQHRHGAAWLWW